MSFLSYSGGRRKQKATPADRNHGCRQQPHLAPYKDLMPSVTSPNCLTLLWTASGQQASWQSTPVLLPRTPSVTIMRMCHAPTGRAALLPMTSMRPAKLKAGAAAVRVAGWKMRSMDNTVDAHLVSASVDQPHTSWQIWSSHTEEHGVLYPFSSCTPDWLLVWCRITEHVAVSGLDLGYLNIDLFPVLHPEHPASNVASQVNA